MTDNRKRIPIPKDIRPGDVLVTRDGHRCVFRERDVDVYTHSTSPGVFTADGRSWSEPDNRMWDVVAIERKQTEQFNRMREALLVIAERYQTPDQLRRADIGLSYQETLEAAYENIQAEAADAVRGVRRIEVKP